MGRLRISSKVPTIPLSFWDELYNSDKMQWPSIVKKYELDKDVEKLNYVAAHREEVFGRMRSSEESMDSWSKNASKYYATKYGVKA